MAAAGVGAAGSELWAWGKNYQGALGIGAAHNSHRSSPVQVGSDPEWSIISGGNHFAMGIRSDGSLWTWGQGSGGRLGVGNETHYSSPVQVGLDKDWTNIWGGYDTGRALKSDGTLWIWGGGGVGQNGDGTTTSRSSPIQVGGAGDNIWSSCGQSNALGYHTVALKTDGTLWSWGLNDYGQLGLGDSGGGANRSSPVQIGNGTYWKKVMQGESHTIAIRTDNTVWSWGWGGVGQLGHGNTSNKSSPVQISSLGTSDWIDCGTGRYHSLIINQAGQLWGWGVNYGQLGIPAQYSNNLSTPMQVGSDTDHLRVYCGGEHSFILRGIDVTDQLLYACGRQYEGQLGDGTTTIRSSPHQIGSVAGEWASAAGGEYASYGLKA